MKPVIALSFVLFAAASCKKKEADVSVAAGSAAGSAVAGSGSAVEAPPAGSAAPSGEGSGSAVAAGSAAAGSAASADCPQPTVDEGEEKSEDFDLNGDGVKDVVVGPTPSDCGSEECPHSLWVARGKCFDRVGDVDHIPELLKTKHKGYFDVKTTARISGKPMSITYQFDGKQYVEKKK
jgi:hypothetical protein